MSVNMYNVANLVGRNVKVDCGGPGDVEGNLLRVFTDHLVVQARDGSIHYVRDIHINDVIEHSHGDHSHGHHSSGHPSDGNHSHGNQSHGNQSCGDKSHGHKPPHHKPCRNRVQRHHHRKHCHRRSRLGRHRSTNKCMRPRKRRSCNC